MHSNVHGAIGVAVATTTYHFTKNEELSLSLAFGSHYLMDYFGETNYDKKQMMLVEGLGLLLFTFCIWHKVEFWFYMKAYFAGILMDLIDKKFYLSMIFPDKFKTTYYLHKQKKIVLQLNKSQTIAASVLCDLLFVLAFVINI